MIRPCVALSTLALLPILLAASVVVADESAPKKTDPALALRDDTLRNWQYELDDFDEPNTAVDKPVSPPPAGTKSGAATLDAEAAPVTAVIVAPTAE